eukprot:1146457-Pelagomonas_calceolata.AAC.3
MNFTPTSAGVSRVSGLERAGCLGYGTYGMYGMTTCGKRRAKARMAPGRKLVKFCAGSSVQHNTLQANQICALASLG